MVKKDKWLGRVEEIVMRVKKDNEEQLKSLKEDLEKDIKKNINENLNSVYDMIDERIEGKLKSFESSLLLEIKEIISKEFGERRA